MPEFFTVVSPASDPLGAVFCAALARSLSRHGARVLLLDLSPSLPCLDVVLGCAERTVYTVSDAARVSPESLFLSVSTGKGREKGSFLFVPTFYGERIEDAHLRALASASGADFVIGLADGATAPTAAAVSDGLLLFSRVGEVYLRAAVSFAETLAMDGFVLADLPLAAEALRGTPTLTELSDALGLSLFGILPRTAEENTLAPRGKDFLVAADNMAGRLMGEDIPLLRGLSIEGMTRRAYFERKRR